MHPAPLPKRHRLSEQAFQNTLRNNSASSVLSAEAESRWNPSAYSVYMEGRLSIFLSSDGYFFLRLELCEQDCYQDQDAAEYLDCSKTFTQD